MRLHNFLIFLLSTISLFGISQVATADSQIVTDKPVERISSSNYLGENLLPENNIPDTIQLFATNTPSTWYYTTYRSYVGYPPSTIYVSVENTAVKRRYHGYLTLVTKGYAPGNWRVYAGTLYLEGGPYPTPSNLIVPYGFTQQ